ncbi:hypothetical protein, partial [Gilliamella sp. B3372]
NGTPVVKYGFTLKQWFVNRGSKKDRYPQTLSWCNSLGYRMPSVRDLTNAVRTGSSPISGANPSSPANHFMRHIGSGFVAEWGNMSDYSGVDFNNLDWVWTSDRRNSSGYFVVSVRGGGVFSSSSAYSLCSHP